MNLLLFGKTIKEKDHDFLTQFLIALNQYSFVVFALDSYYQTLKDGDLNVDKINIIEHTDTQKIKDIEVIFSLGGDGTMLASAILVHDLPIPILGFNTGRLGFLANIDKEHSFSAIDKVAKRKFSIEQRSMLNLKTKENLFDDKPIALNDFTIQKKTSSSMITVHIDVNGQYFNSYWCNGIIVATPTGSTAFSMSCGGPIVQPTSKNIVITPIAPHNLNIRPMILADDVTIDFKIESREEEVFTTLDSRFEVIHKDVALRLVPNDYKLNLVQLDDHSYFKTLRNKLLWGKDVRNL